MTAIPIPSETLPATAPTSLPQSRPCKSSGILSAAQDLLSHLVSGKALSAETLRAAMIRAFGASDSQGVWVWKDAYEAAEVAQVLLLKKYGPAMRRKAGNTHEFLTMIEKLAALVPTQTRRSEDMVALQQFSTPLPLAAIAAEAADISPNDVVLEPSAGTGILAAFAQLVSQHLHLNEIADLRRALLDGLYPEAVVSNVDAATLDDRLDREVTPSVVLMNPPFSVAQHVEGRFKAATAQHVLSALSRLRPGGRLVAITGANFSPATAAFRTAFKRISDMGDVVLSTPIAGRVFAKHGTNVETRLTVIDKHVGDDNPDGLKEHAFFPLMESAQELNELVFQEIPPRLELETQSQPDVFPNSSAVKTSPVKALLQSARAETRAIAAKLAEHPFDSAETVELSYTPKTWVEPETKLTEAVYEVYALQAIEIEKAAEHPTALVQSAAMASVAPPAPAYRPKLPKSLLSDGILSGPQLESLIYAGEAHETHLKGWFKTVEKDDLVVAANADDEGAFQYRKGWFLGDGTGCGKGRQVAGIIVDNWIRGRRRAVWVSKSDKLIEDARRDWTALGGRESDIVPLAKFKQGKEIRLNEGILFVTYATLRSPERQINGELKASRLDQVINWLGDGFDGVIAFDEAHAMANAAGQTSERGDTAASQQGLAGLALQTRVPDARVVYVSATGATEVSNLAYASRLGLWQTGDLLVQDAIRVRCLNGSRWHCRNGNHLQGFEGPGALSGPIAFLCRRGI